MLNKRSLALINCILQKKVIKIGHAADKFNVTDRTIRYDLMRIDEFMEKNGFQKLRRKAGIGIWMELGEKEEYRLNELLCSIGICDYIMNEEERIKYIIFILLQEESFKTIDSLVMELCVSRGTIIKNMNYVKKWFSSIGIEFLSIKAHGIKIKAQENVIRRAIVKLLQDFLEQEEFFDFNNKYSSGPGKVIENIICKKLFHNIDLSFIKKCIEEVENKLQESFSDEAFHGILMYIAIAIFRIRKGKKALLDKFEFLKLKNKEEFKAAALITKVLEEKFKLYISEEETGYIAIYILSANTISLNENYNDSFDIIKFVVFKLIKNFQRDMTVELEGDSELFYGLNHHINSMVYRIKHNIVLKNPLLKEVKERFHVTFYNVRRNIRFMEIMFDKHISEDEIAYITMHFQTAIDKLKNRENIKNIIIVGATGLGTVRFVENKIKDMVNVNVLSIISSRKLDLYTKNCIERNINIDYIVSTVPIVKKNFKVIQVNGFLSDRDIIKLNNYFSMNISGFNVEL